MMMMNKIEQRRTTMSKVLLTCNLIVYILIVNASASILVESRRMDGSVVHISSTFRRFPQQQLHNTNNKDLLLTRRRNAFYYDGNDKGDRRCRLTTTRRRSHTGCSSTSSDSEFSRLTSSSRMDYQHYDHFDDLEDDDDDDDEQSLTLPAYWKPKSAEEQSMMATAMHPCRQGTFSVSDTEGLSELDLLEDSVSPVFNRRKLKKYTAGTPAVPLTTSVRGGRSLPSIPATITKRPLTFWESMFCGAMSRSLAQTIMQPANTMKTILQSSTTSPSIAQLLKPSNVGQLSRGAGANFVLSAPSGAINFAVLEFVRAKLGQYVQSQPYLSKRSHRFGAGLDFISSSIATVTCSIVATPQMMVMDNIMAGNYPNLKHAVTGLAQQNGIRSFYAGWVPGMAGKIPSYALTWTFFQQFKKTQNRLTGRQAKDFENTIMGCLASGASATIMIPMDTIKTRLVTQGTRTVGGQKAYKGIIDCAKTVLKDEGVGAFYRGLPPRLVSVVPLIGIQFTIYEFLKRNFQNRELKKPNMPPEPTKCDTLEPVLEEYTSSLVHTDKTRRRPRDSGSELITPPPRTTRIAPVRYC